MLTEFLKLIQDTAVKAAGAHIIKVDDPRNVHYAAQDGGVNAIDVPPPDRNHSLQSVDSLLELAHANPEGAVWHNEMQVIVVLDQGDRREFATLRLLKSSPFAILEKIAAGDTGGKAFTQQALVRLLRHDLRNAGVEHVLSVVRRIDFKRTGATKGTVEHGRESMGRSVEMEVQGASDIPEFFQATIPVYRTPGAVFHKTVYCTLEIDLASERFVVLPDADSLAEAVHDSQSDLHEALTDELAAIPVYYGSP
jgi:hypothetical protein